MVDVQFLQEADWILSKCGQPVPPSGDIRIVYRMKYFLIQSVVPQALQPGSTQTFTKLITGDTTYELRAISSNWFAGQKIYVQVQLADGSYLSNVLVDQLVFAGYGSNRWVATKPIECPTNSKVILTFDTNLWMASTPQNIIMTLEGAYRYYIRSSQKRPSPEAYAESLPRYLGNPNQNILAPCWVQGYGPGTPPGYEDVPFTYDSGFQFIGSTLFPGVTVPLAGSTVSLATIQMERASDFVCRRFYFWIQADATVTAGSILARIRVSSGYAITNDYFDVFRYVSGSVFAHDINIKAGQELFFDLYLVDGAGTGNMYFQAFAEGAKRYPRTASALQVPLEPDVTTEVIIPAGGGPVRTTPPSLTRRTG